MSNPYSSKKSRVAVTPKGRVPITTAGFGDAPKAGAVGRDGRVRLSDKTRLVNDKGEFNASDKRELMTAIARLQQAVSSGEVAVASPASVEVRAEHERVLAEAWADKSGGQWQALGEVLGDEIFETLGREGFARKTLLIKPLGKGETGRLRIRQKDAVGYFVTADPNVVASAIRQKYVYPPEFYLIANITIEDKEIAQSPGDLLDQVVPLMRELQA